jgi:hypothetical protein
VSLPELSSTGQREPSIAGHVAAPEPLREGRPFSGPLGTWLLWSPPEWGGNPVAAGHVATLKPSREVELEKCYLTRGCSEALPGQEAGPGAMRHVAAHRCTSCFRSRLRACIQRYPICRVPTHTLIHVTLDHKSKRKKMQNSKRKLRTH